MRNIHRQIRKSVKGREKKYRAFVTAGDYDSALKIVKPVLSVFPHNPGVLHDTALCYLRLGDLDRCIKLEKKALSVEPDRLSSYDALAEAYGRKEDSERCRYYGRMALEVRDALHGANPQRLIARAQEHGGLKVLSFSLYGSNPRYIETGYMNIEMQQRLLPDWRCRFYVDDSVADYHLTRYEDAGAEIILVRGDVAAWPGTMWRFLALDDPQVGRILCRDADSLISSREVGLVREWEESRLPFHLIRDYITHTELILAGLWGAVSGYLPLVEPMITDYLSKQESFGRFTDQEFLRNIIWKYIKQHHLAHDRMFGFMSDSTPADNVDPEGLHIGANESTTSISFPARGAREVCWQLRTSTEEVVCTYTSQSSGDQIVVSLPRLYIDKIRIGEMKICYPV